MKKNESFGNSRGVSCFTSMMCAAFGGVLKGALLMGMVLCAGSFASCSDDEEDGAKFGDGKIKGHEYIDLGLSVKWAACNIGASSPSGYGDYFAWGEISTKSKYTEGNCGAYGKKMGDISGDSRYDAARANWGGTWRLPTRAEMRELENNCTWTWTTMNGKNGYKVTGPNGNSIFLPAAGERGGKSLDGAGENGYYWGATPDEDDTCFACYLDLGSSDYYVSWSERLLGFPVRPVSE